MQRGQIDERGQFSMNVAGRTFCGRVDALGNIKVYGLGFLGSIDSKGCIVFQRRTVGRIDGARRLLIESTFFDRMTNRSLTT